jgi:hypothetical protein
MSIIEATVSRPQAEFINSNAPFPAFVGGYGSGKSHAMIMRVLRNLFNPNGKDMAVYMPSYPLIKTIAYPRFAEVFTSINVPYSINKSDHVINVLGRLIYCRTLDNPDSIVGYEVGDSFVDELDTMTKDKAADAWTRVIARNRQKKGNGEQNTVCVTTTPEGYKFTYEKWGKDPSPSYELIKASTYSNSKNLPVNYIDNLKESYPAKLLEAYLNGEFVNLTAGSVYPDFDRVLNHADRVITDEDKTLHIGLDFNVNNMSAAIHILDCDNPIAVGELTGLRDTPALIDAINDLYPRKRIVVYPDASGSSTKTVDASKSDISELKNAGFSVKAPAKNPPVKDRVASFNKMICDVDGNRRYKINTNACPTLVDSVEKIAYDKNGLPDKTSGFDHMVDAPGYFVHKMFPIVKKQFTATKVQGL